jgi:hypothetical protein
MQYPLLPSHSSASLFSRLWRGNTPTCLLPLPQGNFLQRCMSSALNYVTSSQYVECGMYWCWEVNLEFVFRFEPRSDTSAVTKFAWNLLSSLLGSVDVGCLRSETAMRNDVFWDTKPSSYFIGDILRRRYELIWIMLCKIWGLHGGDYEECRLLGYKIQFVLHRRHIISPLQSPAG